LCIIAAGRGALLSFEHSEGRHYRQHADEADQHAHHQLNQGESLSPYGKRATYRV